MSDEIRITHTGPPRSGEVIVTESEWSGDDPSRAETRAYNAIARSFFNQFLEWKIAYDEGKLGKPENYDKEVKQYKRLNETLKKSVQDAKDELARMEEALAIADEERTALREKVNALIIELGMAQEKIRGLGLVRTDMDRLERQGHNFRSLMSPDSQRAWDQLARDISAIPYGGTKDTTED